MKPPDLDAMLRDSATLEQGHTKGLARARAALQTELAQKRPVLPWRTHAALLFAVITFVMSACALGLWITGQLSHQHLGPRAPGILLLVVTSALAVASAVKPRANLGLRVAMIGSATLAAIALVWARLEVAAVSALPEWVCTVSHLGAAIAPFAAAILFLRSAAPNPWRSVSGGLAVGTTGALLGELGCGQGAAHVLMFHFTAWAAVIICAVVLGRWMTPRTFAP